MERLTFRGHRNQAVLRGTGCNYSGISYDCQLEEGIELLKAALEKLADYEDAEEQGLLKMFHCKVGDTVYFPEYDYHDSAIITQIEIDKEGITFYWSQYEYCVDITVLWDDGHFSIDEIGKTVFLTREEAEKELARLKNNE